MTCMERCIGKKNSITVQHGFLTFLHVHDLFLHKSGIPLTALVAIYGPMFYPLFCRIYVYFHYMPRKELNLNRSAQSFLFAELKRSTTSTHLPTLHKWTCFCLLLPLSDFVFYVVVIIFLYQLIHFTKKCGGSSDSLSKCFSRSYDITVLIALNIILFYYLNQCR